MKKKFYPDYLIEVLFFTVLTFELIIILTFLFPPLIGREIDFTASYQPRPEWYFLWLFWLVRFFSGDMMFIGGVLIPTIFIAFFMMIPWIEKKLGRKITIILAAVIFIILAYSTLIELLDK
ncbi:MULTISPECIES: hypothetical protein [Thermodesulfovibrio]|jgi:quinol-cytochrome oxidoreductase complex cytochrome b subunit|uniref:hypothetical protein n=1 Tax=Thermodesulfovibrio TaxID=28261 RepID=UPI00261826A4|nr:hypothetical protein [Thermodesulfovibrio sp.]